MASEPNRANGEVVLRIFHHFNSKIGDALRANNFIAVAARQHVRIPDLQSGLDFAYKSGWVEDGPNGSTKLTADGFNVMQKG